MKKIFLIILMILNMGCGLDLLLTQGAAAKTKKEEVQRAEKQTKKIAEQMKKAEEQNLKKNQEELDRYN
jgi:single-stranded DNA-specific DHH superfamily exonuclease